MAATERFADTAQEGVPKVVSPKAWAALAASVVTTYLVGLAANVLGADLNVPLATALIGPPVIGFFTWLAAYSAKIGGKYLASVGLVDHKIDGEHSDAVLGQDPVAQARLAQAAEIEPDEPDGSPPA